MLDVFIVEVACGHELSWDMLKQYLLCCKDVWYPEHRQESVTLVYLGSAASDECVLWDGI